MDVQTLPTVFHSLAAAILLLWAVQSSIDGAGTKGTLVAGMAMLMLAFGLPLAF